MLCVRAREKKTEYRCAGERTQRRFAYNVFAHAAMSRGGEARPTARSVFPAFVMHAALAATLVYRSALRFLRFPRSSAF